MEISTKEIPRYQPRKYGDINQGNTEISTKKKTDLIVTYRLLAKKYFITGGVLNPESEGSAQSHNNCFQRGQAHLKMTTKSRAIRLKHQ